MTYLSEVLTDAPLGYWRQGDASGPTMLDTTGVHSGAFVGPTNLVFSQPSLVESITDNTSIRYNGPGSGNVTHDTWMNLDTFTIEAWMDVTAANLAGLRTLASRRTFSSDVWQFRLNAGKPEVTLWRAAGAVTVTTPAAVAAGIHYFAATVTPTRVVIYVDGEVVQDQTLTSSTMVVKSTAFAIGATSQGGEGVSSARIDEVALYGTALSAARIAAHYAARSTAATGQITATGQSHAHVTPTATGALRVPAEATASGQSDAQATPVMVRAAVRRNRAHGRQRRATGVWAWEPPVVPLPASPSPASSSPGSPPCGQVRVQAAAFGAVTMNGTQPKFTVSAADVPATRYRFVFRGKDVTFFRGVPVPDPSIELGEPLLWALASVEFPQIAPAFEQLGVGDLRWLRDFAAVEIQRVNDNNQVVATDFRGFVTAFDTRGRTLRVELAGEAHGRAVMMNKQPPIFQRSRDLGVRAWQAIDDLGLKLTPRLGPDTGKMCERIGGTSYLDHIRELTTRSWGRFGRQRTIMPADPTGAVPELRGVYRFDKKDDTTVHGTVFADDARIVAALRRDLAEEPNRIYVTGVTPAGMRVRFGSYPGLRHGKAAPYPFNDGRSFGTGTTNQGTDTGDGISLLIGRLHMLGYLDQSELPGDYDFDVSTAVTDLQRDADLPQTGRVNPATWAALYDLDVTGYSLGWAQIQPAAQRSKVRKWRYSATGAVMGRNPNYKRNHPKVDRNIDMGTGFTRPQMREMAVTELHDSDDPNWVGTITFDQGMGYLAGNVPVGATITGADVRDARSLRPGMNLRIPLFAGGIRVHVAGVNISPDGTVTAAVDTRFRDAAEVWAIITRNRETRRSPGRYLSTPHRSSTITKDSITEWDEIGGLLDRDETLGSEWTVFPVVAGQEGTISRIRLTVTPAREYVLAVFGRRIHPARLTSMIGNPLTKAGSKKWESETVRDRLERDHGLLYVAGNDLQPCGYWPKKKAARNDDDTADAPLTGRWQDDAGFAYRCPDQPVLWVAVWASGPAKLPAGRLMWPQLEAGV